MSARYVIVTGGVCSSLGKGILAASLARLLIDRGVRCRNIKLDPYLNTDPGTMRPSEHGEVFVTDDGTEADLDLGHYERFTDVDACRASSATAGSVYQHVLGAERRGEMLGTTVQAVPHITNEILRRLQLASSAPLADGKGADVVIVEIGGTVGDIEIQVFLEAVRQLRAERDKTVCVVHLVLVPEVGPNRELKTKPAQHSVAELRRHGISPDILVARSHDTLDTALLSKMHRTSGVPCVIGAEDVHSIYAVPANLAASGLDVVVAQKLTLAHVGHSRQSRWSSAVSGLTATTRTLPTVKIAMVGKYNDGADTYLSVTEAVRHAAAAEEVHVDLVSVDAETVEQDDTMLRGFDGILVPGGFGSRGVEGKVRAAGWAREHHIPYLGLCLGLQVAVVDAARLAGITDAVSAEWVQEGRTGTNVVVLMDEQGSTVDIGGTMRLGGMNATLEPKSRTAALYGTTTVRERHRHRYEVDPTIISQLEDAGLLVVGVDSSRGLVEFVERVDHPFFHATQAHPEFLTRPDRPHPLFKGLIRAARMRAGAENERSAQ